MKLADANKLAIKLMKENNVDCLFEFDNAVRRFGKYSYTENKITLSRKLTLLNDEPQVRDTILHEIAHALAGRGVGHGSKWRKIALSIGCDGKRCYTSDTTVTVPYAFVGKCPNCQRYVHRHRRAKFLACGKCCQKYNNNQWSRDYLIKWERINND